MLLLFFIAMERIHLGNVCVHSPMWRLCMNETIQERDVKFEGEHYHQVSGYAMGSPVSAVIAELVMQEIQSKALETSPVDVRWWRRYMDDSNSCLKKCDVQTFHDHLNSINEHIQFTIERPTVSEQGESTTFLDTSITVLKSGQVEVAVYRKATHRKVFGIRFTPSRTE